MNSPTITMERDTALAKLQVYENAAANNSRRVTETDRQIMLGYRVLAKGGRLVDVNEAIRHGGVNLAGLPKLAIARAHAERARWIPQSDWKNTAGKYLPNGGGSFYYGSADYSRNRTDDDRAIWPIPAGTLEPAKTSDRNVEAMTPLIPLVHRPRRNLAGYFLLWEANWHPAPPVDPYLLKPIVGALMEIVAEWDVTPLELAAVRAGMTSTAR